MWILKQLEDVQEKYKNYKEGTIRLQDDEVTVIKCPKSFKYDSFIEIGTKNNNNSNKKGIH